MTEKFQKILSRIVSNNEEELGDCTLKIDNPAGEYYRVRVLPKEGHSWESDLGPAYKNPDEFEAFLRGLEYADDISVKVRDP